MTQSTSYVSWRKTKQYKKTETDDGGKAGSYWVSLRKDVSEVVLLNVNRIKWGSRQSEDMWEDIPGGGVSHMQSPWGQN